MPKALHRLNEVERKIFDRARKGEVNYFTDYYLRGPMTGTWWLPGDKRPRFAQGYEKIVKAWKRQGKGATVELAEVQYAVFKEHDRSREFPDLPAFHHHHGFLFMPWQLEFHNDRTPVRTILGGYGCLSATSRLFDVGQRQYISIADLVREKRAPVLLAWTGQRFTPAHATIPFRKGNARLYRVETASGRSVTVHPDHVFLTEQGWQKLSEIGVGATLLGFAGDPLPSNWEHSPEVILEDAQHWMRITQGSQSDYQRDPHFDDGRPHWDRESFQGAAPSPDDVPEHNQHYWPAGDRVGAGGYSRSCLSSDRRSSLDFLLPAAPLAWPGGGYHAGGSGAALALLLREAQAWQQSRDRYSPVLPIPESDRDTDPVRRLASSWEARLSSASSTPKAYNDPIIGDKVTRICAAGAQDYYDLHVPIWNNYLAEGLIHHNSGKTMAMVASLLIHAATLPGFRAFGLAPQSKQANEIYRLARQLTAGTLYEERFILGAPASPNGRIEVGNDFVTPSSGALPNTIECYPILNQEDSMLTLTGDCAIVDQAEKFEDLDGIIREVGTRFRGRDMATGREKLGTLTFIANSEDNQALWDIYDMAAEDPRNYKSYSPSTYDNPGLTERDIQRYEMQVGGDRESIRVHLLGGRPLGNGKEFSKATLENMRDPSLDQEMELGLQQERPGYTKLNQKLIGPVEWLLPYKPGRKYLVISDPGTDNAPNRNAPAILVWDITDFPGAKTAMQPARLAGFVWGGGNNDIKNWARRHAEMVHRYQAISTNGFDATGFQAGYDQWMYALQDLLAEKITLAGNNKALCLNAAKMLTSRGLLKMPVEISGMYGQLVRYELPEPSKLRQDLVMAFIMSAWWLMRLFYMTIGDPNDAPPIPVQDNMDDRYARPVTDRYDTPMVR